MSPDESNCEHLGGGRAVEDVLAQLESMRDHDVRWRDGRAFSLAYLVSPEAQSIAEEAYRRFSGENALNTEAFPSLRKMSTEVVDVALGWTHAPVGSAGFMTSGGTESLIMAVWAAIRRREREHGSPVSRESLNVVLPTSAHAALEKACAYFGVESRRIAVKHDWRADVDAMRNAVDAGTILLVGSAPQYPQGVIDDIPRVAQIAADSNVNCHVDACMGGVTLTYLERAGHYFAPWDFRVEGVTSISIDLHKYGYVSKGAGVLLHRTKALRADQTFVTDNWLGGLYGSSGILGTKSGGPIASAWAVMRHLGDDGYTEATVKARDVAVKISEHIAAHQHLVLRAMPDTTLVSFGCRTDDNRTLHDDESRVFAIADQLRQRGWYVDKQTPPASVHLTVNAVHARVVDDFLFDLDEAELITRKAASQSEVGAYGTID